MRATKHSHIITQLNVCPRHLPPPPPHINLIINCKIPLVLCLRYLIMQLGRERQEQRKQHSDKDQGLIKSAESPTRWLRDQRSWTFPHRKRSWTLWCTSLPFFFFLFFFFWGGGEGCFYWSGLIRKAQAKRSTICWFNNVGLLSTPCWEMLDWYEPRVQNVGQQWLIQQWWTV